MKWLLAVVLIVSVFPSGATQRVYMTSLEWPPYSGEELEGYGLSVAVAREAFAAMGYELVIEFKPWVRAVALASKSDKYVGYFPEYYFNTDEFVFSDSIGSGPLGLVENIKFPIEWSSLEDLTLYRIGVVQGYVNTAEFDLLVEEGMIQVEASANDIRNIYKVAKGRLDAAVIDSNVLDYLIGIDPRSDMLGNRVKMNSRLLESKELYLAFKNTPEGHNWRDVFNEGLKKIDVSSIVERYNRYLSATKGINSPIVPFRAN
ncbi:ABC transporter substrate-binding protein [Vibrio tubiashii]|uniref:substrate-binding periplasmic protein n=1 Tax=Vibrio tubiashii TaxID=29498 RepID=UPI001EFDA254|nr:ABC transporter substrate-binding protein [Vibrio tubiashii]MCG9583015.1 ABC transporter substrate-binding protein [Vibrio tubiashii]MCG9616609.1 ABC transporter substrate-binding protein [Vibrio tubiashii]MCG9690071.1 ABC transporter substrate-binding protein [Vibrio tubiashii]